MNEVLWLGKHSRVVLIITSKHVLYRSHDEGRNWKRVSLPRGDGGESKQGPKAVRMILHPSNADRVLIKGIDQLHWVSHNAGASFKVLGGKLRLERAEFHYHHSHHILATQLSPACFRVPSRNHKPQPCMRELLLSKNFGKSWKRVATGVKRFGWANSGQDAAFAMVAADTSGNQFSIARSGYNLIVTKDLFKTTKVVMKKCLGFKILNTHVFAARLNHDKKLRMYRSGDDGFTFIKMRFPGHLAESRYTVLSADDYSTAVSVEIGHGASGSVFVGYGNETSMTLALRNNARTEWGNVDWVTLPGLNGTVFANVLSGGRKHTFVSHDGGSVWHRVSLPRDEPGAESSDCWKGCDSGHCACSLHLHLGKKLRNGAGRFEKLRHRATGGDHYGPFYSKASAPGLVVATGNIGRHLSFREDDLRTYMSRDGGRSWQYVKDGSNTAAIGDQGAITAVLSNRRATHEVVYSMNSGSSWHACAFSEKMVEVQDLVSDPNATTSRFLVIGREVHDGRRTVAGSGVVVSLDFSRVWTRSCVGGLCVWWCIVFVGLQYGAYAGAGRSNPDGSGSDFESWGAGGCVNGRQTRFVRCL